MEELVNRIAKIYRHRRRWAGRQGLTAWRIYDRDIPGHRYTVDWYDGYAVVVAYPSFHPGKKTREPPPDELRGAVARALSIDAERVFVKVRLPASRGRAQYGRLEKRGVKTVIEENGALFEVNLSDYNDTGLFLDHRLTRARVREQASGRRFLNLFCYTGSFTVSAALGGAETTTSVDLSKSYLAWTRKNLTLNGLEEPKSHLNEPLRGARSGLAGMASRHETIRSDAVRWLHQNRDRRYDLIVLDPPSYSVSKKMEGSLEIERDYPHLIAGSLLLLSPGGVLYFSTNYRGFDPDPALIEEAAARADAPPPSEIEELTPASIPEDFRDRAVHRCLRIIGGSRRDG